ncbi:MAG: ABC transporter ATP-binding protein [Dehalococcoidia bacterium]
MATLSVQHLQRRYDDEVVALEDVSFAVEDGRIAAILGPSGCGKTTVLRLIAGLDHVDHGDVQLGGASIVHQPPHTRGVGLMFQELALFPHLDVAGNIDFGLRMLGWSREDRELRRAELLRLVGLVDKGHRKVHELSGGEQQRVALARALAPRPGVLMLDEPLGALDEARKEELRLQLRELLHRLRMTAVIVSHDLRDAVAIADDLIVMERGRVLQAGPISEVLARPATASVARMVGYATLLEGTLEDGCVAEDGVGAVRMGAGNQGSDGDRVTVLGHPAALLAVPAGHGLGTGVVGVVASSRPDGPVARLEVSLADRRTVAARWEWDNEAPPPGTRVDLAAQPGTLRFFTHTAVARPKRAPAPQLAFEVDRQDVLRPAFPEPAPPAEVVPIERARIRADEDIEAEPLPEAVEPAAERRSS